MKIRKLKTRIIALPKNRGRRLHSITVLLGNKRIPLVPSPEPLEETLCRILANHNGERGDNEGAEETLRRIIYERDRALTVLALDRLKQ